MQREGATNGPASRLQKQSGRDEHSIVADAQFMDPARGDYRVKVGSPAFALGFVNFPMDSVWGVQKPALKALARTPVLPGQKGRRHFHRRATLRRALARGQRPECGRHG